MCWCGDISWSSSVLLSFARLRLQVLTMICAHSDLGIKLILDLHSALERPYRFLPASFHVNLS